VNQEINNEIGAVVARSAGILNSKISALLTHVSIMIAIVTIIGSSPIRLELTNSVSALPVSFIIFMKIELAAYVLASLLCVVGIWTTSPRNFCDDKDATIKIIKIVRTRRRCFILALWITVVSTGGLIIALLLEWPEVQLLT
jgi:hypothetical protein